MRWRSGCSAGDGGVDMLRGGLLCHPAYGLWGKDMGSLGQRHRVFEVKR